MLEETSANGKPGKLGAGALDKLDLEGANLDLAGASAQEVIEWAAAVAGPGLLASTSFGIQSGVLLHLLAQVAPRTPVVWVDTGYLLRETYLYAEQLTELLGLRIEVYQPKLSPARMEALHGRPWERGDAEALDWYDLLRKVEPMQRALRDLGASLWLSGLRAEQTARRAKLSTVNRQWNLHKVLPLLQWTAEDVTDDLERNGIPAHPLYAKGYLTVGDWHTSRPVAWYDTHERDTRFLGLKQECGLHAAEDEET